MDTDKIKELVENGLANKRIAINLKVSEKEIKDLIKLNGWQLVKEKFSEDKIDYICALYTQGVSAKQLGIKYSIDKRRIMKWAEEEGILRSQNESRRFTEFNQNIFDIIDTPEKAYWLGFFYADAYNSDTACTFILTLKGEDYPHIVKLANFVGLSEDKVIKFNSILHGKEYPSCYLKMYSKHLCDKMTELGCPRAKSFVIKYPQWLNNNLQSHFLRGLFEGDGCLTYRENQKEWRFDITSTKEMCEDIQKIIMKGLGFLIHFHCISETGNNTYSLEQSGNEKILKIMDWLYKDSNSNMYLDRKYKKYLDLQEHQNNKYKTAKLRESFRLSEEDKTDIIQKIKNGAKFSDVTSEYNIHPSTIVRFIKLDKENDK